MFHVFQYMGGVLVWVKELAVSSLFFQLIRLSLQLLKYIIKYSRQFETMETGQQINNSYCGCAAPVGLFFTISA